MPFVRDVLVITSFSESKFKSFPASQLLILLIDESLGRFCSVDSNLFKDNGVSVETVETDCSQSTGMLSLPTVELLSNLVKFALIGLGLRKERLWSVK